MGNNNQIPNESESSGDRDQLSPELNLLEKNINLAVVRPRGEAQPTRMMMWKSEDASSS